jgi:hypothetical protein
VKIPEPGLERGSVVQRQKAMMWQEAMKVLQPWTWFKEWRNLTGTQQSSVAILVIGAAVSIFTYAAFGSGKAYYYRCCIHNGCFAV